MKQQIELEIQRLTNEAAAATLEKHQLCRDIKSNEARVSQIEEFLLGASASINALRELLSKELSDAPGQDNNNKKIKDSDLKDKDNVTGKVASIISKES